MIVDTWLDYAALHKIDRMILYSLCYGGVRPFQQRIDEEGCGVVFAAAKYQENE